jgi:hypothetical protein
MGRVGGRGPYVDDVISRQWHKRGKQARRRAARGVLERGILDSSNLASKRAQPTEQVIVQGLQGYSLTSNHLTPARPPLDNPVRRSHAQRQSSRTPKTPVPTQDSTRAVIPRTLKALRSRRTQLAAIRNIFPERFKSRPRDQYHDRGASTAAPESALRGNRFTTSMQKPPDSARESGGNGFGLTDSCRLFRRRRRRIFFLRLLALLEHDIAVLHHGLDDIALLEGGHQHLLR